MISENKNIVNNIMSKKIIGEIAYLKRMSKNVPNTGESRSRVDTLIELYTNRKIAQSSTVENIIKAYIGTKTAKQRLAVHTKFSHSQKLFDVGYAVIVLPIAMV